MSETMQQDAGAETKLTTELAQALFDEIVGKALGKFEKSLSINSDLQRVIDITFSVAVTIHNNPAFKGKSGEEIGEWVAEQLRECGFDTQPMGMSWGVLKHERS